MSTRTPTRIAITGAAGFLGGGLVKILGAHYPLRLFDVKTVEGPHESIVGDVSKLDDAMALCAGCSDLVIGHMAPQGPQNYGTPTVPFDVNVKGTANLFHAAVAHGIQRVVLISSGGAVQRHQEQNVFLTADLPYSPKVMYTLTKALQEQIARFYFENHGIEVAVLRPFYICDEDSLADKYGVQRPTVNYQFIDPRDIAEAARLSLIVPKLGYDIFYLLGHPDAETHADVKHLRDTLGWKPKHTFEKYPRDGELPRT
jgi:nucleoside-diphosphate-sugar epimerase